MVGPAAPGEAGRVSTGEDPMGKTTRIRWRSIATTMAMAMLLALLVPTTGAFAHPGEHNESAEGEGIGVDVTMGDVTTFFPAFQWAGTPAVDDETAEFVYAGSGCSPANYLADDFEGKIALVDDKARTENPSDPCPISLFFQKVQSAEKAGAIGFVQVPIEKGRSNATAIVADIPALELKERTTEAEAFLAAVKAGEPVTATLTDKAEPIPSMGPTPCSGGTAGPFACDGVDLLSLTAADTFDSAGISDLWGWTDPDGGEYVIIGKTNGVAFFRVTDPTAPEYLGELDNPGLIHAVWHDIKVFNNHAFIVSESENHGMTVFDLTRLRDAERSADGEDATEWDADASYPLTSAAHNLEINEEIGMAY
ncbi:MAG: choice-of-anchor B family protein, partial [Acidimicrobiales bacterium]